MASSFSTVTDNFGKFTFKDTLEPDIYVLEANNKNTAVFIDSINVQNNTPGIELGEDTLKQVGAISGIVHLLYGGNSQNIYVLAFGINRFVKVNADGSFFFPDFAEGTYTLWLLSGNNDYDAIDIRNVVVHENDTTVVDPFDLPYRSVPVPRNLSIAYDTLRQLVTLAWSKLDTSIVSGYNVYRRNFTLNGIFSEHINYDLWKDTLFVDSMGQQDTTYEYRVTAINKNNREGVKSDGVKATIASYLTIDTVIELNRSQEYQFESITNIASKENGELYVFDPVYEQILVFDASMNNIRKIATGTNALSDIMSIVDDTIFVGKRPTLLNPSLYDLPDTIYAVSTMGEFVKKMATQPQIVDVCVKDAIIYMANAKNKIYKYSTDGTLLQTWNFNAYPHICSIFASDSNSIFLGTDEKVYKINSNGEITAQWPLPFHAVTYSIIYDSNRQVLYFSCGKIDCNTSRKYSGSSKVVVYALNADFSEIAEYWFWKNSTIPKLALQNDGSLIIGLGVNVIRMNPLP